MNHPEIAKRSCDDCEKYVFNAKGRRSLHPATGEPILRSEYGPGCTPDCSQCPKCDGANEKTPATGRKAELSERNRMTLELYYQAKVGRLPKVDAVLRHNLGIIEGMVDSHARAQSVAMVEVLAAAMQIMVRR